MHTLTASTTDHPEMGMSTTDPPERAVAATTPPETATSTTALPEVASHHFTAMEAIHKVTVPHVTATKAIQCQFSHGHEDH